MKITTDYLACAPESLEAREERYGKKVDSNPEIQEMIQGITDKVGVVRNAILAGKVSTADVEALEEFMDDLNNLILGIVDDLAEQSYDDSIIAFHLGRAYSEIRDRRDSDNRRRE